MRNRVLVFLLILFMCGPAVWVAGQSEASLKDPSGSSNYDFQDRSSKVAANLLFSEIICSELGFVGSLKWGPEFNGYASGIYGCLSILTPIRFLLEAGNTREEDIIPKTLIAEVGGTLAIGFSYYSFEYDHETNQGKRFLNSFIGYSVIAVPIVVLDGFLSRKPFKFM